MASGRRRRGGTHYSSASARARARERRARTPATAGVVTRSRGRGRASTGTSRGRGRGRGAGRGRARGRGAGTTAARGRATGGGRGRGRGVGAPARGRGAPRARAAGGRPRYYGRIPGSAASSAIVPDVHTQGPAGGLHRQLVQNRLDVIRDMRHEKSPPEAVIAALRNLPRGYTLTSDDRRAFPEAPIVEENADPEEAHIFLAGYTLREIAQLAARAGVPRETLFVYADVIDFSLRARRSEGDISRRNAFYLNNVDHMRIVEPVRRRIHGIPLSEIHYLVEDDDIVEGAENRSIVDILEEIETDFMASYAGGSGANVDSTFVLYENIRIEKRFPFPNALRGQWSFRTGGFDRIFLQDNYFTFNISGLLENLSCGQAIRRMVELDFSRVCQGVSEWTVYTPGSLSRYLDGFMNCVAQCLHWCLYQDALSKTISCLESPELLNVCDKLSIYQDIRYEVVWLCTSFFDSWIATKKRSETSSERENYDNTRRWTREWSALVRHGFSNVLLRRFAQHLRHSDIDFDIFAYYEDGVEGRFRSIVNGNPDEIRYFLNAGPIRTAYCFQMNLLGEIQRIIPRGAVPATEFDIEPSNGSGIFPGLLHCIGLYPSIPRQLLNSCVVTKSLLSLLNPQVKKQLTFASQLVQPHSLHAAENPEFFERCVHSQRLRQMKNATDSTFGQFSAERRQWSEEAEAPVFQQQQQTRRVIPNCRSGVIVYDLETVENLRGCQMKVDPRFRKDSPAAEVPNPNIYSTPESQIPYSVQWGVVNMDVSAEELRDHPENILLERVRIEYGSSGHNWLGECVQDFVDNALELAVRYKWSKVYCYAHNGCGFDAYLILKFIHSPDTRVRRILITPRGVLSLQLNVGEKVDLIFRDTKVFFGARLADLCKIFRVPEKYCKTDFPITRVHARNYDDPKVRSAYHEYLENDVWSLAFIIYNINVIIEKEILKDVGNPGVSNPHATGRVYGCNRFVTLMSLVTQVQKDLFTKVYNAPQPPPVDIPALRNYVSHANIGGRVTAFWRFFKSSRATEILISLVKEWKKEISEEDGRKHRAALHADMLERNDYATPLDVTSLYPYAMSHYPMPTGKIMNIPNATELFFDRIIPVLDCLKCHQLLSLCEDHLPEGKKNLRLEIGFSIFVIKNLHHEKFMTDVDEAVRDGGLGEYIHFRNLCARKTARGGSLVYSFEDYEVINSRGDLDKNLPSGCSSFTMYDLYWMHRAGWIFEIVAAFGFESTYYFRQKILEMFESRKAAKVREKEEGLPKSLSMMWKNLYNGMYGVNAKKDIQTQYIATKEDNMSEQELRRTNRIAPDERIVFDASTHQLTNKQWLLKIKKHADSAEYFADQSPNHIGAAVTSAARHHMNLLLFSLSTCEYGYTDTDSAFVRGDVLEEIRSRNSSLLDESPDANMGTYKNDHEGPGNNITFLSFLLAKKVKLHVTVNALGEVQFHETFKGMNPSPICKDTGKALTADAITFQKIRALGEIFFEGTTTSDVPQSEWRRSLADGITIDKNAKYQGKIDTYYGRGDADVSLWIPSGNTLRNAEDSSSSIELIIPNGWPLPDERYTHFEQEGVQILRNGAESREMHRYDDVHLFYAWQDVIRVMEDRIRQNMEEVSQNNPEERQWDTLFNQAPQLDYRRDYFW